MLYYTRRRAGAVYLYDVSTDITNRFNLQISVEISLSSRRANDLISITFLVCPLSAMM